MNRLQGERREGRLKIKLLWRREAGEGREIKVKFLREKEKVGGKICVTGERKEGWRQISCIKLEEKDCVGINEIFLLEERKK